MKISLSYNYLLVFFTVAGPYANDPAKAAFADDLDRRRDLSLTSTP